MHLDYAQPNERDERLRYILAMRNPISARKPSDASVLRWSQCIPNECAHTTAAQHMPERLLMRHAKRVRH